MTILTSAQATSFLTNVTTTITDNMAGLLVILGGAVGIGVAFGLLRFGLAKLSNSWK